MTLDEGVARLLEQCDREDANPDPGQRFLRTIEIRSLLGVVVPQRVADEQRAHAAKAAARVMRVGVCPECSYDWGLSRWPRSPSSTSLSGCPTCGFCY